ncbi:replicative DNA helicase loader DnaB [Granulicatella balaenopterae]|uniref:Replicative DNA helicase loader DnaB n=1 Tax=Granulicatella balaenopterae TaxID=137733 RepID=A0A1H9HS47_9LACT|nr:DnaD domain protein [Granulicatella balaenopterae]SEQ65076.1 replicative DNA helicase loader DnaB [Granulicatella balaenopterae]
MMEYAWSKLTPKDALQIWQPKWITELDLRYLTHLYQPFIGQTATILYTTLFYEISPSNYYSEWFRIGDMLAVLNIGMAKFYEAKTRLEGIGLLKTYQLQKEDGNYYKLELIPPVAPDRFFRDPLLSSLLISQIGHQRFAILQRRYSIAKEYDESQEVTANFSDVFVAPFNVTDYQVDHYRNKHLMDSSDAEVPQLVEDTFNWELLYSLLKSQFVSKEFLTEEVKRVILTLHVQYGVSEEDMVPYIMYATDLSTGITDPDELMKLMLNSYEELQKTKKIAQKKSKQQAKKIEKIKNQATVNDIEAFKINLSYSDPAYSLVKVAKKMNCMEFLESIKKQRHGYVAASEQRVLRDLVDLSGLPSEVINILIHYILVVQDNTSLTKNFADAIANDWGQRQLKTAEDAVTVVRTREKEGQIKREQKVKQVTTKRNYQQKPPRIEKLPEWAKHENTAKDTPLADEKVAALKAKIAKLKSSQKEPEEG